jgi:hypothetical protein
MPPRYARSRRRLLRSHVEGSAPCTAAGAPQWGNWVGWLAAFFGFRGGARNRRRVDRRRDPSSAAMPQAAETVNAYRHCDLNPRRRLSFALLMLSPVPLVGAAAVLMRLVALNP